MKFFNQTVNCAQKIFDSNLYWIPTNLRDFRYLNLFFQTRFIYMKYLLIYEANEDLF